MTAIASAGPQRETSHYGYLLLFIALVACAATDRASRVPSGASGAAAAAVGAPPAPTQDMTPSAELQRGCDSASDCEVAWLLLDCCGSMRAVGVSKGTRELAEGAARSSSAGARCECLAAPTELDSGQTTSLPSDIALACEARACVTRLLEKPAEPAPSASAEPSSEPPVACKSDSDCWVSEYPERPIARPKGVRHRFRGCVDGEVPPVCDHGVCALGLRYRC